MILFQTYTGASIDFTDHGLTFNEESSFFTSETTSNYTFPFTAEVDSNLSEVIGLVLDDNITRYNIKTEGYLTVDNEFFDAYLAVNQIRGTKAELKLFYGKEVLAVFDKKLKDLPFPIIDTNADLDLYSSQLLTKSWPDVTHNFPKYYRPQLQDDANNEAFLGYINNRENNNADFIKNVYVSEEGKLVVKNYNIVAPCPYLLEVLKVGYASEGLQVRGDLVNHPVIKKIVLLTDKYFNYNSDEQRRLFKFTLYPSQENGLDTYFRNFIPQKNGTYKIKSTISFPKGILSFFSLKITYNNKEYFSAVVENASVKFDEQIEINVENDVFTPIKIELIVNTLQRSIADFNTFLFDYVDGDRNVFPDQYSLAEVMPDMTFREYESALISWLNLDVKYYENAVYFNFLDDTVTKLNYIDHSHLEDADKDRVLSTNNLFKLKYANDSQILITKNGQVYDDTGFISSEITTQSFDVLPVSVISNNSILTGTWPNATANLVVGIYDGLKDAEPVLVDTVNNTDLSVKSIYTNFHKNWLNFRAKAELYKDVFDMHFSDKLDLRKGLFKYNKKHIVKKVRKKRLNERWWRVTQETESF